MRPLIERLTSIRNELARTSFGDVGIPDRHEVTRMLDSIAENAATARSIVDHGAGTTRAHAFVKRVRKALGYTYP